MQLNRLSRQGRVLVVPNLSGAEQMKCKLLILVLKKLFYYQQTLSSN